MRHTRHRRGRSIWSAPILALWAGIAVTGCDSLIDVSNPNNVGGDDAVSPVAATNFVNGALFTLQDGYDYLLQSYSTASDELTWIGSRDAFQELDFGTLSNPQNEFTDVGFVLFSQGFWMTREAIRVLEGHRDTDSLANENDLARAYLYGAIMQVSAADWLDDMVVASDRREAAPPVGPDNMGQLYTQALDWISAGLAIVDGSGTDLERNLLAYRARAEHSQAVWNMIGTRPISIANNGLVDAGAASAQAALDISNSDWAFELVFDGNTQTSIIGNSVNNRLELAFGRDYVVPVEDGTVRDVDAADRGINLNDPVSGLADMRLDDVLTAIEDGGNYPELRVVTAREMQLILAEAALANSDMTEFANQINAVRDLDEMPDWTAASGVTARDMLIHERRVNMFLMGQRLNDLYRFGQQSSNWQAASEAVTAPGTFLPITKTERDANCHINPDFSC